MRRGGWWWVWFVLALLVGLFFALAAVGGLINALAGNPGKGTSRSGDIVGAVICALIAAGAIALARRFEHRARTGHMAKVSPTAHPVAVPATAGAGGISAPAAPVWLKPGRGHPSPTPYRHHPHSSIFAVVVLGLAMLALGAASIASFGSYQQTRETQHHGIAANATVTQVISEYHSSRYSSYYTYDLEVDLASPVNGHTSSKVHTPDRSAPAQDGDQISVLVDPKSPGYAELPGVADNNIAGFVFLVVLFAIFLAIALAALRKTIKRRRANF